jgi:hypothetical protein
MPYTQYNEGNGFLKKKKTKNFLPENTLATLQIFTHSAA